MGMNREISSFLKKRRFFLLPPPVLSFVVVAVSIQVYSSRRVLSGSPLSNLGLGLSTGLSLLGGQGDLGRNIFFFWWCLFRNGKRNFNLSCLIWPVRGILDYIAYLDLVWIVMIFWPVFESPEILEMTPNLNRLKL